MIPAMLSILHPVFSMYCCKPDWFLTIYIWIFRHSALQYLQRRFKYFLCVWSYLIKVRTDWQWGLLYRRLMQLLSSCFHSFPQNTSMLSAPTMRCLLADSSPGPYPLFRAPMAPLCVCAALVRLCISPCPLGMPVDGPTAWLRRTWMASSKRSRRSSIRLCFRVKEHRKNYEIYSHASFLIFVPILWINIQLSPKFWASHHDLCVSLEALQRWCFTCFNNQSQTKYIGQLAETLLWVTLHQLNFQRNLKLTKLYLYGFS